MTTPIDATAGIGAAAHIQKFDNPAGAGSDLKLEMSDMAQKMLNRLGDLQADFDVNRGADMADDPLNATRAVQTETAMMGAPSRPETPGLAEAMTRMGQQMENSVAVQAQLVQFTLATSMSSSLGKNLNMFLRGQ